MTWKGKALTHIGKVRTLNQDAFGIHDRLRLWVIADGMGGHAGGEVASALAIQHIPSFVEKRFWEIPNGPQKPPQYSLILTEALEASNQAIRDYAQDYPELLDMGTTAVVLSISEEYPYYATIAHIGDSRAYLFRDQSIRPLTRDHSLVEDRLELGTITPEEALTHPLRHLLTRALGIDATLKPSVSTIEISEQDQIMLCTDGLTKMMTDEEILHTVLKTNRTLGQTCQALVEEANHQGGEDNVTVVMVGIEEPEEKIT